MIELRLRHSGGADGTTTLSWFRAATLGGNAVDYVVVVEDDAVCTETYVGETAAFTDSVTPPPGVLRTFLVQAENGCGRGPLGTGSFHEPRAGCN